MVNTARLNHRIPFVAGNFCVRDESMSKTKVYNQGRKRVKIFKKVGDVWFKGFGISSLIPGFLVDTWNIL